MCIYVPLCVCAHVCVCIPVCVYMYICTCACVCICACMRVCVFKQEREIYFFSGFNKITSDCSHFLTNDITPFFFIVK